MLFSTPVPWPVEAINISAKCIGLSEYGLEFPCSAEFAVYKPVAEFSLSAETVRLIWFPPRHASFPDCHPRKVASCQGGPWILLSRFTRTVSDGRYFSYLYNYTEFVLFIAVLENSVLPMGRESSHAPLKVTSEL